MRRNAAARVSRRSEGSMVERICLASVFHRKTEDAPLRMRKEGRLNAGFSFSRSPFLLGTLERVLSHVPAARSATNTNFTLRLSIYTNKAPDV